MSVGHAIEIVERCVPQSYSRREYHAICPYLHERLGIKHEEKWVGMEIATALVKIASPYNRSVANRR
jgi:hypothetical protein